MLPYTVYSQTSGIRRFSVVEAKKQTLEGGRLNFQVSVYVCNGYILSMERQMGKFKIEPVTATFNLLGATGLPPLHTRLRIWHRISANGELPLDT